MKKYFLATLLIVVSIVLNGAVPCFGADQAKEWECLFCHQYPGLVMPEKADRFKVISIDKEKHFSSPHGKIGCIKCHTLIKKVPHTGLTDIECTTECHLEDKEKIDVIDLSLYSIHENEQCSIENLEDHSSCRVCHPLYPHSNNKKIRALLNMHTGYMVCDMCHLKKVILKNLTYDWKSPDSVKFYGKPYGRYSIEGNKIKEFWRSISRMFKRLFSKEMYPEQAGETGYVTSRIAAFSVEKEKKKIVMNTQDTEKAIEFTTREKIFAPGEKEKELNYFHRDITKKEFSVACNECHSSKGGLDFKKLGYDDQKAKYLKELDVKRLETEYEIFYFPHMFER
ncbi:hypothetical protein BMS3Bbin09_00467 [bacterium BMS3Bbin09]|nr:hypothetical protein BMS3Bbin09_00467 [bacterium BMS3Bbin09]